MFLPILVATVLDKLLKDEIYALSLVWQLLSWTFLWEASGTLPRSVCDSPKWIQS